MMNNTERFIYYVDKLRIYVRSAKLNEHHSFGESLMKGCL